MTVIYPVSVSLSLLLKKCYLINITLVVNLTTPQMRISLINEVDTTEQF